MGIFHHMTSLNGEHAYRDTESRKEEICGIIVLKWKVSPAEECDR